MNLLFFAVFLLFSVLILRLGVVQIVNGEGYKREVERTEDIVINTSVPRGKIYDRFGNVIVDNVPLNAITYTRTPTTKTEDMVEVAKKLASLIEKDTKQVQERDKKDYWMIENPELAREKVSEEEIRVLKEENEDLSEEEINAKVYDLQLKRITEEDLNSLTAKDLEALAIFREFNSGYALTPQIVKNEGVTAEEFAVVSERLDALPGVNTTTDWERAYVYEDTLRTILGNVSSAREGLPREMLDYYLSKDYNRNDRVGTSFIEYQYEEILQGQKEKIKNITKGGSVLESQLIQEGQRGKDVVLTIDMELQKEIEKIVEEELLKQVNQPGSPYLDRAFVVMMDPNTGEILSMVGKKYDTNPETGKKEINDYALGTFTSSYEAGSAVKGATVLTGYMTGVLRPGEYIVDEPIYIKGTPKKSSWYNQNGRWNINDLFALEKSSNSYMFKIALRINGDHYVPNQPISSNPEAFSTMRYHFAQFGLGVPTGIDLPSEHAGFKGESLSSFLLDYSIGQFDTYTPMQLVQYASTIANGGYRIQPHIMKEIREPINDNSQLGPIIYEKKTNILNRIDATPEQLEHVQKGFYQVFHGSQGTAQEFANAPYEAAGKSGTAETFHKGTLTYNTTLIGYAPVEQPEIAFSTVVPRSHQDKDPYINKIISRRVMDKYFELKKKRESEGLIKQDVSKEVENLDDAVQHQTEARETTNE